MATSKKIQELWCTVVVDLPKPLSDDQELRPLKESNIKFIHKALPLMEVIKAELLKLGLINDKKVLGRNKSSTDHLNSSQQMIFYNLFTRAKIHIGVIIFNDLVIRITDKPRKKYVAYLRFLSCVLEHLLGSEYTQDKALGSIYSVMSKLNYHRNSSEVPPNELTEYMLSVVNHQALMSPTPSVEKLGKKKKSQIMTKPTLKS
ncbi:hypothetical protein Tco_0660510 [Tanacetum coccineum]